MLECPAMSISFSDRVKIPDDVLISKLQEESVILNLDSERYYGLDDVGTRFLNDNANRMDVAVLIQAGVRPLQAPVQR